MCYAYKNTVAVVGGKQEIKISLTNIAHPTTTTLAECL